MIKLPHLAACTGILLVVFSGTQAAEPFGAQVRGNDLETGKSDEVGGVGLTSAEVDNLPEYRAEAGIGGATFTPLLKAEASNPNSMGADDRTSSIAEAYQRFRNTSGSQLDVVLSITLDADFTSTGPDADSYALADVWIYGGSTFEVFDSPICPGGNLGRSIMLGDVYFCGQRLDRANMFLETDPAQAASSGSLVETLMFSVAPGAYFGVYGILRANAIDGSSDAFNTLSMEFDPVSAASLEASGMPPVSSLLVTVDIKPDSDPNSIDPGSSDVIPVAVMGSIDFDAAQLDPATVTFGVDGATPTLGGRIEDVDTDGFMDALFQFRTQESGIACGDTEAALNGELFDGTMVSGTDTVDTTGCNITASASGDEDDDDTNAAAMSWWFLTGFGLLVFRRLERRRI